MVYLQSLLMVIHFLVGICFVNVDGIPNMKWYGVEGD